MFNTKTTTSIQQENSIIPYTPTPKKYEAKYKELKSQHKRAVHELMLANVTKRALTERCLTLENENKFYKDFMMELLSKEHNLSKSEIKKLIHQINKIHSEENFYFGEEASASGQPAESNVEELSESDSEIENTQYAEASVICKRLFLAFGSLSLGLLISPELSIAVLALSPVSIGLSEYRSAISVSSITTYVCTYIFDYIYTELTKDDPLEISNGLVLKDIRLDSFALAFITSGVVFLIHAWLMGIKSIYSAFTNK